jgi:SnoaL-like protein
VELEETIGAFDRAWNETDGEERLRLIEGALTEEAELVDPRAGLFQGRDAVAERLEGFQSRFPGARVDVSSEIDAHHGFARYAWTMRASDGSTILNGFDFIELADDGRIRRVVMFFGDLPAAG